MIENQTLEKALEYSAPAYYKKIYLAVRAWGGASYSYDTEVDITDDLVSITNVKTKLDWESYGVWAFSNCTLTFRNDKNQWKLGKTDGYFGTDKIIFLSKIRILAGSDDTGQTMFYGYVTNEPIYNTESRTVSITIIGHMKSLELANAENVSTLVEDELLGSDAGAVFTTAEDGVGIVVEVVKGATGDGASLATALKEDTEYKVTDLNDKDNPATITLTDALTAGNSAWVTYRYWYQDKTIEWIVTQLVLEAGITSYEISPAVFVGNVENTFAQLTATDFDLGTDDDTIHTDGDVSILTGFPPALNLTWTQFEAFNSSYAVTATSIKAGHLNGWASAYATQTLATGTWQFSIYAQPSADSGARVFYYFISSTENRSTTNGYCLSFFQTTSYQAYFILYKVTSGTLTQIWASSYNNGNIINISNPLTFRIARNSDGEFTIWTNYPVGYWAWVSHGLVATDTTHSTSAKLIVAGWDFTSPTTGVYFGITVISAHEKVGTEVGSYTYYPYGQYLTPTIDGTGGFLNWGKIATVENAFSGAYSVIETRDKTNIGDAWGLWVQVSVTGDILSTKRYLQVRWTGYVARNCHGEKNPTLQSWTIYYYTTDTTIEMVNLTNQNCFDAISELAKILTYEIGFDSTDKFIFRPRTTTLSPSEILDDSKIINILNYSDGTERVYNRINTEFGDYRKIADSTSESESSPTSIEKYGTKELTITSGNLLPASSVNLAYVISPTVFDYTYLPKRRLTARCRFFLKLELGDTITVKYSESDILKMWHWGDSFVAYSTANPNYVFWNDSYAGGKLSVWGVNFRIEGIEFDLENWNTIYDLVEII